MRGARHLGQSFVEGENGLRLASLGALSPGSLSEDTTLCDQPGALKTVPGSAETMPAEKC